MVSAKERFHCIPFQFVLLLLPARNFFPISTLAASHSWSYSSVFEIQQSYFGHIHQYPKVAPLFKKNLGGGESRDLFSNQQMGLEVQKNLGLLMLSEVEGGS